MTHAPPHGLDCYCDECEAWIDTNGLEEPPLRVLSLFAGIGALDLGLEAHGCATAAYSEIHPHASAVMALRFPDAVNLGDITTIDWNEANEQHGPFDIICGGFPCQDISVAGKGAGIADGTRSGLWANYATAIRVLRPRGVLVENVSALLARGIDRVLGDLAALGFDAEWDCVPAAAVGAPHLRDRVFLVAYGSDARATLPDAAGERPSNRDGRAVQGSAERRGAPVQPERRGGGVVAVASPDPERERGERRREAGHVAGASGAGQGEGHQRQRDGDAAVDLRAAAAHAHDAGRIEQRWPVPNPSELTTAERGSWWTTEPQVGRVVDGFPGRVDRLHCLGNAVVPQVAEHVAGILINRMEQAA